MRLVYPDLNGRYDISGLPSGAYLVSVAEELYDGELFEREVFDAIVSGGNRGDRAGGRNDDVESDGASSRCQTTGRLSPVLAESVAVR